METAHRLGEPLPQQIAVVRALPGLGDLLCVVPALRALRAALPGAHIALVGLPGARPFVARFDRYLDELVEFPGYPGIPERTPPIELLPAFFTAMHRRRFDLALQMHGSGITSNPFTVLLGARITAGFYLPDQYCPDADHFLLYPEQEPEVRRYLRLMEFLGVPLQGEHLEFPLADEDVQALHDIADARDLRPGEYVCLHPGASTPARRWPPAHFARVADRLARQGLRVVLTGVAQEVELTEAIAGCMQARPLNLAGRTSLGALAALLRDARLLVCNDTGVSHLAVALRVPSVVIFTGSDPVRWGPLDRRRHRVVTRPAEHLHHGALVGPVRPEAAALAGPASADGPTLAAVLAEVEALLREEGLHVA